MSKRLQRRLHAAQVVLWLKQSYVRSDGALACLEALFLDYVVMCWHTLSPKCALLSRPSFGKMVRRAFPAIRTQRFGGPGRRYYVGLRRLGDSGNGGCGTHNQRQRTPLLSWVELMIPPM